MLADELIKVHEKPRQVAPFGKRYPAHLSGLPLPGLTIRFK